MTNPQAEYSRKLLQSRVIRDRVIEKQAAQIRKLLKELESEIDGLLKSGSLKSYATWQRSGVQRALQKMLKAYGADLNGQIALASEYTAEQTLAIRTAATEEFIKAVGRGQGSGIPVAASINTVSPDAIKATIARMYPDGLVLSERIWVLAKSSSKAINNIIIKGIIQGESAKSMSMKLRGYIRGAEALPEKYLLDLRRLPRAVREKRIVGIMEEKGISRDKAFRIAKAEVEQMRNLGQNIAYRSFSMARSEVNTSYHEAHIAGAQKSPVVKGQAWNLSGRHLRYDECDILASNDFYGLGPGVYPIGKTPHRAHTYCLCYLTDVLRPIEEWEKPKPNPGVKHDPMKARVKFDSGLSVNQKQRYRMNASELVKSGDRVSKVRAAELV